MNSIISRCALCMASISFSVLAFADTLSSTQEPRPMPPKMITPSAMPAIQHGSNVFVTADFIYWTARVDNLEYAHTGVSPATVLLSEFSSISKQGSYRGVHHKLSPGFKAALGFAPGYDGWDTLIRYTYLRTGASSSVEKANPLWSLTPGLIIGDSAALITANTGDWHLHFNNADWELGREYFISSHLLLRPFLGLKGSWQRQTFNIGYTGIALDALSLSLSIPSYTINNSQYFWGAGPRAGLNTTWQCTHHWSLFGDCAFSALWSYFKVKRIDHMQTASTPSPLVDTNVIVANESLRFHSLRPVLELDLGMRWDYWFLDDDYRIRIQAAWEQQVWFNQNQFLNPSSRDGLLSLQGLTAGFRLDF